MLGTEIQLSGHEGLPLVADAYGAPDRPPVLLMHGGGQTRHAWGGTAEALARQGWYAVALDLRGHGDSGWADDGDYTVDAFVADLLAVATRFDTRPALVGASLGGMAALLAEGEISPGLASAVVLVDITPRMDPHGVDRILGFMQARPDGFESLEDAAEAVALYLPHRPRPRRLDGLRKNLRRGPDGRYRWHWDPSFMSGRQTPTAVHGAERMNRAASALRLPTMLVRGKLSELVSEEAVSEFLDLVPHAQFTDVSGAGHMVAGDRNDAFTEAVLGFLSPFKPGSGS